MTHGTVIPFRPVKEPTPFMWAIMHKTTQILLDPSIEPRFDRLFVGGKNELIFREMPCKIKEGFPKLLII